MSYLKDFFYLFFPRLCLICNHSLYRHENLLCSRCLKELPRSYFHLVKDNPVDQIFWGRVNVEKATSFLIYSKDNKAKEILHAIKYNGKNDLASKIGMVFSRELIEVNYFGDIDVVVPVPIHPKKKLKRGYNQSDYLAEGMADVMGATVEKKVLLKVLNNSTQTKKNRFERWQNVEDAYMVADYACLAGKNVLLVDDVVTTGATLEACAKILLQVPNIKLNIATIAYANR